MANEISSSVEKDWLDPVVILRVLYGKWKVLLGASIAVGVLTAIATLFMPNVYESSAALIVREPSIPVTGEASPLAMEMLQALADSAQIKYTVFTQLREEGTLPQNLIYRDFQRKLRSSVQKKISREMTLVPMVALTAKAQEAETASRVANRWADLVTSRTNRIYTGDIDSVTSFTMGMYKQADDALRRSETEYTTAALDTKLSVTTDVLTQEHAAYARVQGEILDLEIQLKSKQSLFSEVDQRVRSMQVDGMWAGDYYVSAMTTGSLKDRSHLSSATVQVIRLLGNVRQRQRELATFEKNSQLQYKEMLIGTKEKQLELATEEIVKSEDMLAKAETQEKALVTELAKIPEKITLDKAITDDALWNSYLQSKRQSPQGLLPLKTEESNPVYENIKESVVQLAGEIGGQKARAAKFRDRVTSLTDEVSDLAQSISTWQAERDYRKQSIETDKSMIEFLVQDYNNARQQRQTLSNEIRDLSVRLSSFLDQREVIEKSIADHERYYYENRDRLAVLERNIENRTQVRGSLAAKAEEVTLLQLSAKQTSRSGVAVLYRAEINPIRIGLGRRYIVLGSMVVCFFLLGALFVMRKTILEV